ncbi:MAG: mechanosensitive ion channel [Bacteroidales bacterium]|nr:mechanosensitive ion channel [Bacteroidales bacterium]
MDQVSILIATLPALVLTFGGKLLIAIIIFLVGKWVAKALSNVFKKVLSRAKLDSNVVQFFGNIAYGVILIFVILAAVARLGVQTTSFIAILGAATLAIGMALQGTLGNFSSGVMLMIFKPFRIGDSVIAGGVTGTVHDIGIFQTIILASDNRKVMIPNGKLSNDTITNFSAMPTRRVEISVSVPGTTNISAVRDTLLAVIANEASALKDPPPSIVLTDATAEAIVFGLNVHVINADYGTVHARLVETVKLALTANGIWA